MTPTISPAFGCSLYRPQHDDPATACLQQFSKALQIWSRTTLLATTIGSMIFDHLDRSSQNGTFNDIYTCFGLFFTYVWTVFHQFWAHCSALFNQILHTSWVASSTSKSSTSSGVWNIYPPQLKIYSGWELPCNGIYNGIYTIGNMNITVYIYRYIYICIYVRIIII